MIKTGFYFSPGSLWHFHFNVAMMAALWLLLFVSFILLHSGEHQRCTTLVFRGLIFSKIHTCVFWGVYKSSFGRWSLVQNDRLLSGGTIAVSIKSMLDRDEKDGTCVHLARELFIPAALPASLGTEVGNVSSHNRHILQTCCLSFHSNEGRWEQNCNPLIVSFITYSVSLTLTCCFWNRVPGLPLVSE